jgi:hypothetical protein
MKFNKHAHLGKSLQVHNIRIESEDGEEGGDAGELVPARAMRFTGVTLTKGQLNEITGHPGAADFFFDYSGGSKGEPVEQNIGTIWLDQQYKNCSGTITFGVSAKEIAFEGARVKNISVKVEGKNRFGEMAFTLIAPLPKKLTTLELEEWFGKLVKIELALGERYEESAEKKQGDLLAGHTDPEASEDSDTASRTGTGAPAATH